CALVSRGPPYVLTLAWHQSAIELLPALERRFRDAHLAAHLGNLRHSSPVFEALHGTQRVPPFRRDRAARYIHVKNRSGARRWVAARAPRAATRPPRRRAG